ncbi:SusD/RagB family nutrient-binding outer membrane lipoprotein [Pseudoflavitalea rhizosphaerae]|uniref:SusD/RagB family nutrient-binding outer membrane lipoprotein n=1 Tax=Pseudoflavitalea rhizosphaerae TaxID=1884793 RepID=UPI000F8F6039|nr:SusD/RagB family nutrient-binding outer membrane lipoprotein [Pseudoflavitalea rhizosphaerae]
MKKVIHGSFLILLLGTAACTKMLDINKNPNLPTEDLMKPDMLLSRIQNAFATRTAVAYNYSAHWMGYWVKSGAYGVNIDQDGYRITSSFERTQWGSWYQVLYDNHVMEQKAKALEQPFYVAIAKLLKTSGFMYLVDQYNNVPYFQAFDLVNHLQPAYDKGEIIYQDLLKQLDTASAILKTVTAEGNDRIEEADVMFHGDPNAWRKLVNTQRLKILIHLSETGMDVSGEINKILNDGAGLIGSKETVSVNPGYVQDVNKQSPFYDTYVLNVNNGPADNYNRANNYILGLFRDNDDVRLEYVFAAATSPVGGELYRGYDLGDGSASRPSASATSGVGGPAFAKGPSQSQWWFTSVESLFLQAEAIQRGWLTGNAEEAYRKAVTESFIWLNAGGNEAAAITAANEYLASGNSIVDWSQATTDQEKIELIIQQKYLAMIGLNNFEPWVDYRRVGVPDVPRSVMSGAGPHIPLRLLYPQREYSFNAENVEKEGNIDPFTSAIFWDK